MRSTAAAMRASPEAEAEELGSTVLGRKAMSYADSVAEHYAHAGASVVRGW